MTRFMQLRTLWPFPEETVAEFCRGRRRVFVVENSYTGQLERLIRYVVGPLPTMHSVRKYDGKPFRPIRDHRGGRTGLAARTRQDQEVG